MALDTRPWHQREPDFFTRRSDALYFGRYWRHLASPIMNPGAHLGVAAEHRGARAGLTST
jgi:hypothetical protein